MSSLRNYILDVFDTHLNNDESVTITKDKKFKEDMLKNNDYIINACSLSKIYDRPEHVVDLFIWPPNVFVVLASLLDISGRYKQLISSVNPTLRWSASYLSKVEQLANDWRTILRCDVDRIPREKLDCVTSCIQKVFSYKNLNKDFNEILSDDSQLFDILVLTSAADETFREEPMADVVENSIFEQVKKQLVFDEQDQLSFSSKHVGTVHYKKLVCQSGISLNSISSNIAFIKPDIELEVIERNEKGCAGVMNVLILPWPVDITRKDFVPVLEQNILDMDPKFGFFSYKPNKDISIDLFLDVVRRATEQSGNIDLVVLPECAISDKLFDDLKDRLRLDSRESGYYCPSLISGVYEVPNNNNFGKNLLKVFVPPVEKNQDLDPILACQNKHHRWYLDRNQIFNYKLGSDISPSRKWWEFIEVDDRKLINYRCHDKKIQITPLICEDLARQDPVAPAVRALGPTLIIALLLDGPQLRSRWPGRYANFLSEDPGSSVLTVTPLGMTLRSDGSGFKPSRVVSFWSESGGDHELELADDKSAIILTLEKFNVEQWTADGRKSECSALRYAGHVCL